MNSALEEIWSARAEITAQCHHNAQELIAYYQERQKIHQTRLVRPDKQEGLKIAMQENISQVKPHI